MEFKKRMQVMLITALLAAGMLQTNGIAADFTPWAEHSTQAASEGLVLNQFVTRFIQAGEQIDEITFQYGQPESELTAQMPQTLDVMLADDSSAEIPVTWVCVDDYANTDDYYYSFVPQVRGHYELADDLDPYVDVPYIIAERADNLLQTAPDIYISEQSGDQNASTICSFLMNNCGFNSAAACGVLANIEAESNFNPSVWGDNETSYGICQWHGPRLSAMQNWCSRNGYDWRSLTGQLYYLKQELSGNSSAYLYNGGTINKQMLSYEDSASGAYQAGYYWCCSYEVPRDKNGTGTLRGNRARNKYWPIYGNKNAKPSTVSFYDISGSDWFYDAVQYVYKNGIMTGTNDKIFEPNATMNRAMAATVLYAVSKSNSNRFGLGSKYSSKFKDVPNNQWFTNTVRWAAGSGIVYGYSNTQFAPKDPVTREQFLVMLHMYAKKLGKNVSSNLSLNAFSDRYEISEYAEKAVQWAAAKNIVTPSGDLRPADALTRAEAAVMIQKFMTVV